MVGAIIAGAVGIAGGAVVVLLLWTIATLQAKLNAERKLTADLRSDLEKFREAFGAVQQANVQLAEKAQGCEDIARNALAREQRPIYLRPEEALAMAQVIGAMMDKVKIQ